jgi:aryl-alcohol dehydrogenase-like predicted oxidoreductase
MSMELVLGTVQFGLPYGIAGRTTLMADKDVRSILSLAWERGIRQLDTAPAYGNIEERLDRLCGPRGFEVISKVPALGRLSAGDDKLPAALTHAGTSAARLGGRLKALLFHDATDLEDPGAAACWQALRDWAKPTGVLLGSSGYGPEQLQALHARLGLDLVQVPGNAFDQRVAGHAPGVAQVHLRSAFLQGLLLMAPEQAAQRLPATAAPMQRWLAWCAGRQLSPLEAALSVVKGFAGVTHCLVGVDSAQQLDDITQAWDRARALAAPELAVSDAAVTDPRQWRPV